LIGAWSFIFGEVFDAYIVSFSSKKCGDVGIVIATIFKDESIKIVPGVLEAW
jgi:hypothetical protein